MSIYFLTNSKLCKNGLIRICKRKFVFLESGISVYVLYSKATIRLIQPPFPRLSVSISLKVSLKYAGRCMCIVWRNQPQLPQSEKHYIQKMPHIIDYFPCQSYIPRLNIRICQKLRRKLTNDTQLLKEYTYTKSNFHIKFCLFSYYREKMEVLGRRIQ